MPATDLWELATYEIKPRLNRLPGVASVLVQGGQHPEYQVTVDPAAVRSSLASLLSQGSSWFTTVVTGLWSGGLAVINTDPSDVAEIAAVFSARSTLGSRRTVIVTGGSTSGCVRATVVDSLSRSYRTIVPEECVADKHESPHFANLYDMTMKYADVLPVAEVINYMKNYKKP